MTTSIHEVFSHPEVEMMVKISGTPWTYDYVANETSLLVIELYNDNTSRIESMNYEAFAVYCRARNLHIRSDEYDGLLLRIIFAEPLYLPPPSNFAIPPSRRNDHDNTALLMHQHFNVPMLFFRDQAPVASYLTIGNAMFVRRDYQGELDCLDGYYQYCSEKEGRKPTHTWFSHSFEPKKKASNYIIHQCPKEVIRLVRQCAEGSNPLILTRPFAIDAFLLNHLIMEVNSMVINPRATLLGIEKRVFTHEKVKNVSELHRVARDVRFIKDTVGALLETLDNVISAQKQHMSLVKIGQQVLDLDRETVRDSLSLLRSKANSIMREVSSLEGRASLKIDLEYNLENQQDSRTNLRIARLTTDIAAASQKDSSSMITMAAVTMFFLPGTFVSAFFSMIFFNPEDAPDGGLGKISVSPQWWLFPAITIPLTIIVFLVWIVWKRQRNINQDLADFQKESEEEKALLPKHDDKGF